jgi:hypothetical protein
MTLSSGCGSKTLIRAGAGNLKSLVVMLVLGISAYMTLKGCSRWAGRALDPWRFDVAGWARRRRTCLRWRRSRRAGGGEARAAVRTGGGVGGVRVQDREFRASPELVAGSIVIGLVIVGGWYVSGHVGYVAEDPLDTGGKFFATNSGRMESFTFVAPYAYTLELLMLWSDASRIVTFGVASVFGCWRVRRLMRSPPGPSLGRLRVGGRRRQPPGRCGPDGFRRRDRPGLHDRAGHFRRVHARRRLVPGLGRDHRRLHAGGTHQVWRLERMA